jgi:hypothetical protein
MTVNLTTGSAGDPDEERTGEKISGQAVKKL